jgi:protein-tyrosine phosphatase
VTAPAAAPFSVLMVCTGNICRSPAAELLLRAGLDGDPGVEVSSAGLAALAGQPVDEPVARLLADRGVGVEGFTARQLQLPALRTAGLVLTMTAAQRSAVVTRLPAAVRRTFTLREFAELTRLAGPGTGAPAERLAALVAQAPRLRAQRTGLREDDIEDPYERPDDVVARVFALIDDAVAGLLDVVVARPARTA